MAYECQVEYWLCDLGDIEHHVPLSIELAADGRRQPLVGPPECEDNLAGRHVHGTKSEADGYSVRSVGNVGHHGWVRLARAARDGSYRAAVSYTHLRAHETVLDLVCRLLLE